MCQVNGHRYEDTGQGKRGGVRGSVNSHAKPSITHIRLGQL